MIPRKYAILLFALMTTLLASCGPHVDLIATRSRRVEKDNGRIDAILVESMYKTKGLHGQQMLYEVDVLDSMKRPVNATRSSYRNTEGHVAGSRTVMAEEVTGEPSHVIVQIPVNVLGIGERQLPAYARVRLASSQGEPAAEAIVQLPLSGPDVASMGGEPVYAGAENETTQTDEQRVALGGGRGSGEPWADESESRKTTASRDRPSSKTYDDVPERSAPPRDSYRDARSEPDASRADASRREPAVDNTPDASGTSDDGLTYWSPDRQPIRRGEEDAATTRRRDGAHDDRVARREPARNDKPEARTPTPPVNPRADEIADLESAVSRSPNDIRTQMRLRMLYLAERREADALAPIAGADPDTQIKIEEYLAAILPAVRNGEVDPLTLGLPELDRRVAKSRDAKQLRIPVAAFCRSIDGFGKYVPHSPAVFRADKFPRLLIYLEVENFVSTRAQTGVYRTLLSVQQKLLNSSGVEVWSTLDQEIPDLSNGLREDFFLAIGPIDFQQVLPPDEYTLVISLRDSLGGGSCDKRMAFRITGR